MDLMKSLKEALENLEKIGRVNLVAVINETTTEDKKEKQWLKEWGGCFQNIRY